MFEGHAATLRLLSDHRDDVARRSYVVDRLHALLSELLLGTVPECQSASQAAPFPRRSRSSTGPHRTRRRLTRDPVREARRLDADVTALHTRFAEAAEAANTTPPMLFGIGPRIAARFLGHVRGVRRFPTAARFASYDGVAPIEASGGDIVRHRLSRAGDRQLNYALHIMVRSQARQHPDPGTYYLREPVEGHCKRQDLRRPK